MKNFLSLEKWESLVAQSCLTLCDAMDYSPLGFSVRGILQARILEWISHSLLQGVFLTQGSNPGLLHCRRILYHLTTREAQEGWLHMLHLKFMFIITRYVLSSVWLYQERWHSRCKEPGSWAQDHIDSEGPSWGLDLDLTLKPSSLRGGVKMAEE